MRHGFAQLASLGLVCAVLGGPARAETVMQQCGHQYQDAKAAGTLNGATWNQFRTDCAARLKTEPAAATAPAATASAPAAAAATPAVQTANPLNPAPTPAPSTTPAAPPTATAAKAPPATATGGRAAFLVREKQCGAEWRANKASLTAQTPGLTWPKYLSQCNARLKSAGK